MQIAWQAAAAWQSTAKIYLSTRYISIDTIYLAYHISWQLLVVPPTPTPHTLHPFLPLNAFVWLGFWFWRWLWHCMFLEFYGCLDTQFVYNAMQNRGASSAYNMPRRLGTLWRLLPKFVILDYNLSLKWDIRNEKCASSLQNKKNFLSCIWHATQPANQRKLFLWLCVPHKITTEVNFRSRFLPILDRQFCCYLAVLLSAE